MDKAVYDKEYYKIHQAEILLRNKRYRKDHKSDILKRQQHWYNGNLEKVQNWHKEYSKKIKAEVFSHYESKCQWPEGCDIIDPDMLQIDHIDGGGNRQGLTGLRIYRWLIKNNYPSGYRLLCANHNLKHRMNRLKEGKERVF